MSVFRAVSTTKLMAGLSTFTGAMRGPLGRLGGSGAARLELIEPVLDLLEGVERGSELLPGGGELGLHLRELSLRDGCRGGRREPGQGRCEEQGEGAMEFHVRLLPPAGWRRRILAAAAERAQSRTRREPAPLHAKRC